jgi:hypothetical protein
VQVPKKLLEVRAKAKFKDQLSRKLTFSIIQLLLEQVARVERPTKLPLSTKESSPQTLGMSMPIRMLTARTT